MLDARRLRVIAESVNKCDRLHTDVLLDLACGGLKLRTCRHLRGVLVESAWRACEQVPAYTSLFHRVSGRGGKQVAIVAVARRLLEDAWTMLRKGEPFRYVMTTGGQKIGSDEEKTPSEKGADDTDVW